MQKLSILHTEVITRGATFGSSQTTTDMKTLAAAQKKLQSYAKKIDEHNAEIAKYIEETESNEVPILESTFKGYDELKPLEYKLYKNVMKVNNDGFTTEVKIQKEDDEYYITGWDSYIDGIKQDIAYNRKRIKAGYKIWNSSDPDRTLEHIDDLMTEE